LDLSGRRPASDRRQQSSARYAGAAPASDWYTSPAILNSTRCSSSSSSSSNHAYKVVNSTTSCLQFFIPCENLLSDTGGLQHLVWYARSQPIHTTSLLLTPPRDALHTVQILQSGHCHCVCFTVCIITGESLRHDACPTQHNFNQLLSRLCNMLLTGLYRTFCSYSIRAEW